MSDHAFRVYQALKFIDQNLFEDIDLEAIAKAGTFSPFHFHRVFSSLMGTTVKNYVSGKRLGEACQRLLNSDQGILDLALECQFESQEAFTRAFKKRYDITPGQLRKVKKKIESERPIDLSDIESLIKGEVMKANVVTKRRLRLFAMARAYSGHNFEGSYEQWAIFAKRAGEIGGPDNTTMYGVSMVSHPDVPKGEDDKYLYMTAVEVFDDAELPEDMIELNIPERKYAQYFHKGHIADYMNTYKQIYNNWLPESGLEVSDLPEIEVYGEKFKLESSDSEVEILIPILG